MKRFVTLIIVVALCVSMFPLKIFGQSNSKEVVPTAICNEIIYELSIYEQNKHFVDMTDVDFSNLDISEKIFVYEYAESGFVEMAEAYLLFENEKVVSLAYKMDGAPMQLMTDLGKLIGNANEREFSIIYDADGCHLYTENGFKTLVLSDETIENRNEVCNATINETSELQLSDASNKINLPYKTNIMISRATGEYSCSVGFVEQTESNLCWAACVAMIVNKLYGTNYTDVQIAIDRFSSSVNYNQELSPYEILQYMNGTFSLNYSYISSHPSDNVIINNITSGYPVMGGFQSVDGSHACIIYGINIMAGRLMIKNPESGSQTCSYSSTFGGYYYIKTSSGTIFVLDEALCRITN